MSEPKRNADFFKSDRYRKQQRNERVAAFEAECVATVLRILKLQKHTSALRTRCAAVTGRPLLRFAEFHEEFPSFPIFFGAQSLKEKKLHEHDKMRLPDLFKTFWEAPFVAPYLEFRESVRRRAGGRAVGLVFHRSRVPGGLVVHDGQDLPERAYGGLALVYRPKHPDEILYEDFKGRSMFVQPLSGIVSALFDKGHGWRP